LFSPANKSEAAALIRKHTFTPIKKYGQNFLVDGNIIGKIVAAALLNGGDTVIEIGPGLGALTFPLAREAGRVIAVEADEKIIPLLREAAAEAGAPDNLDIVNADFMEYELPASGGYKLVGNLPYYITTPILMRAAEAPNLPELVVCMMQREVAQRITAAPGGKSYGAVSVAVQYRFRAEYLFDVPAAVFMPKPAVDSSVIRLTPLSGADARAAQNERTFFALVKAGFGQRRKMLRNSLKTAGFGDMAIEAAFAEAGISPMARAEQLSVADFIKLADAVEGKE
jgi:16S rRNA (adenine1518-N6/adenine1519-N6)-dimethyltransferase